jgi:hypothetical protein
VARIRTIKPSFWESQTIAAMSRDARLLALALISMSDDQGRFVATPAKIMGHAYPHDDNVSTAQVKRWLDEVTKRRDPDEPPFAVLYEVDGCRYGWLPKWRNHQRISKPQPSTLPAPPAEGLW